MPLEFINGRLVQVDKKLDVPVALLSDEQARPIIESAEKMRQVLPIPDYVPEDKKDVVAKYLAQFEEEVWQVAVVKWKFSSEPTRENLVSIYQGEMKVHFLSTDTLVPANNQHFITENTYAIGDQVGVENVVNCTGGIFEGRHKLGFHILGFTQIGNSEQPITPEAAEKVGHYIDQLLDILGEPPEKITINASTLGKGIDNLDLGHLFVERLIQEKLAQRYPDKYLNPESVEVTKVRSLNLSST